MYQVTVKGRTLEELKIAVNDINNELSSGVTPVNNVVKDLSDDQRDTIAYVQQLGRGTRLPTMELAEGEEEVQSPYATDSIAGIAEAQGISNINEMIKGPDRLTPKLEAGSVNAHDNLDIEGIPWDKRIHASSKGKVAKGTWRTKRGLDPAILAQVKAELLQAIHIKANPIAIPALPITPTTPAVAAIVPVVAPVIAAVVTEVVAPIAPAHLHQAEQAPVVAPVAPINGGHTLESFRTNMAMVIGTLITEGKLTQDYVNTLMTHFGVTEIWNVTEEQKEEMFNTFVTHSIIVKVG